MRAELDHLVVAARTLPEGVAHVAALTGTAPVPGGRHPAMGTHNALLRLGPRRYLEVMAIDPEAPAPGRPRWFDLDDPGLRALLSEGPRLVHWVARTEELDQGLAACPVALGEVHAMARGSFRWRITVPGDGRRPLGGLLPALIRWDVPAHPADALPPSPVTLERLEGFHPDPGTARAALAALGLGSAVELARGPAPRLVAVLRTPRGLIRLEP